MIDALVIAISFLALIVSIFTFIWRDLTRVSLRLWVPSQKLPEMKGYKFVPLPSQDQPYVRIINFSPFEVKVERIFYRLKNSRGPAYDFPLSGVEHEQSSPLPHVINARRSHTVLLTSEDLTDLWKHKGRLMMELDTQKTKKMGFQDARKFQKYLQKVKQRNETKRNEADS